VDETNATIGLVRLHTAEAELAQLDAMLLRIQNELFDLGADLCVPDEGKPLPYEPLAHDGGAMHPAGGRD
jgi:cob(I)alamin adenosyltransferase